MAPTSKRRISARLREAEQHRESSRATRAARRSGDSVQSAKRRASAASLSSTDPLTASPEHKPKRLRRSTRATGRITSSSEDDAATVASRRRLSRRKTNARDPAPRDQPASTTGPRPRGNRNSKSNSAKMAAIAERTSQLFITPQWEASIVIPPWKTLPYYVLVNIFAAAADQIPHDKKLAKWLLDTGLVCRSFCEPALTVLYQSPPLDSRSMALKFLAILERDPSSTTFNYRQKVERLRLNVGNVVRGMSHGSRLDLPALVRCTPRLNILDLFHDSDLAPYRTLDENLRWAYPDELFEAMGAIPEKNAPREDDLPDLGAMTNPLGPEAQALAVQQRPVIKLIAWRWNSRLTGGNLDLSGIKALHLTPTFSGLKKVEFLNWGKYSLSLGTMDAEQNANCRIPLADAINSLKHLEFLTFESSGLVDGTFLALLPTNLRTLKLVNCEYLRSEDLSVFLLSRGRQLRHLSLWHNQSLDLAFLTVLGEACPHLQTLSIDMLCYRHHTFYNDSNPNYDEILNKDQVPSWPTSVETIALLNLRKWNADAAEMFFQSLVDSAPRLPSLRHLELRAMLDIPFRQRSKIRDKWSAKLRKVFLRKWMPPAPFHTLRKPVPQELLPAALPAPAKSKVKSKDPKRSSTRLAKNSTDSSSQTGRASRGLRQKSAQQSYTEPDSSEFDDADEEEPDDEIPSDSEAPDPASPEPPTEQGFVHGLCDFVSIKLDNQKPVEHTWSMHDFLDSNSDNSSDADWDSGGDTNDDRYA